MTDWLLGTLLATSGLILLVLLIREPVRQHFGARIAYGLWLIPTARLLMPPLTETVERPAAVTGAPPLMSTQIAVEPLLLSSVAPAQPSLIEQLGGWPTILITLWLGIAVGFFVARMTAFRRERAAIMAQAFELDWIGNVRVMQSGAVSGPLAFGIFNRVIAVPTDFELFYAPHERRLALEHELSHHRSGDLIVNFFAFVLLCLQWFNPLAWIAHAAFRFDQEAACDARVLDKIESQDRADYGRAIAKAASGRALMFASALDHRKTLHRRLKSMLTNPSIGRRVSGRAMLLAVLAAALPLTATRAVEYVDAPVSPPAAPFSAIAQPDLPQVAPVAPVAPVHSEKMLRFDGNGMIHINGQTKQWRDLTPAEKSEIRREIAHAKAELARTHIDREQINREVRAALAEANVDREDLRRELAEARSEIERAMQEVDAHVVEIRRSGQNPEHIKATIRASLKAVEAIDVDAIKNHAVASIDHRAIEASVVAAEASVAHAQAEIERVELGLTKDD